MRMKPFSIAAVLLTSSLTALAQPGPQPVNQAGNQPSNPPANTAGNPNLERVLGDPNRPVFDLFGVIDRLADQMDKEFIVDPRLDSRALGWTTSGDAADYNSLLAVLRTAGFATIEIGDEIRIVPEATARAEPSRVLNEDDSRVSDHAVITRVIDLGDFAPAVEGAPAGAGAASLVPVLRPLMSTAIGNLSAIPGTNTIVIVDRYDNVRRITAIVEELRQ